MAGQDGSGVMGGMSNPSEAEIAAFHQRKQEGGQTLSEWMGGHRNGAPSLEEAQGLTSQSPLAPEPLPYGQEALELEQRRLAQLAQEQAANANGEVDHWKKLYGQGENEKGELRRALEAAQAQAKALEEQMAIQAAMQSTQLGNPFATPQYGQMAPYGQPYGQPQYPQPPYPAQPAYAPHMQQPNFDPFSGRGEDDVWTTRDVKALVKETLAPIVDGAYIEAQRAAQQAAHLQAQMYANAKAAAGVTPLAEQKVLMANPWLQGVQDPFARLNAIKALMPREVPPTAPTTPPAPPIAQAQQQATQRVVYVETGRPTTGATTTNPANAQQLFEAEWAKTLSLPYETGERTEAQRRLLQANGVGQMGWGSGVLSR